MLQSGDGALTHVIQNAYGNELTSCQTVGVHVAQCEGSFAEPAELLAQLCHIQRTFGCRGERNVTAHDDVDLINAVQSRVGFAPGEWIVVWVESQAIHSKVQHYKVIDAALGVIERGTWRVADAVREQPWLPRGPIPLDVTWTREQASPVPVAQQAGERLAP